MIDLQSIKDRLAKATPGPITNHDARCLDWYRRLIKDGLAEDGQRIAVEMEDRYQCALAEILQLRAELEAAIRDITHPSVCDKCKRTCDGDLNCIIDGYINFAWRGRDGREEQRDV